MIIANQSVPLDPKAAALAYAERGWRVIPCHTVDIVDGVCTCGDAACGSAGKHPITTRGIHEATTDSETIARWWAEAPEANVGIATGVVSGLWVLDLDGTAGLSALIDLEERHEALPDTLAVETGGGGRHLYFRYPSDRAIGNRARVDGLPVDVRGDGGYVLAPPSLHKSGRRYSLSRDVPIVDAPAWLLDWIAPPAPAQSSNGHVMRVGASVDKTHRVRAYLATCDPAISGQGGHATAFRVICSTLQGFDLSADQLLPMLDEWNARCSPPWSEKELRHKLDDASKQPGERGRLLRDRVDAPATTPAAIPTTPPAQRPPFPVDALPEVARDYVIEGTEALGCEQEYIALPTLAVLAGAIGNTRRVRLKRGWSEPCVLWAAVVAESGTLKSPAFDLALRPLRAAQDAMFNDYAAARKEYEAKRHEYDAELAIWKKKRGGPAPEAPEEPICQRVVVADTTMERLAVLLSHAPRGLLLARDELAGWLAGMDQYRARAGADVANWLELHRAGTITVDRKTGNQTIHVPRAAVSVCGTIQPATLRGAITRDKVDNGLAARILCAMPRRRRKRWTEAEVSRDTSDRYALLVRDLLALRFAGDDADPRPVDVLLSSEARAQWTRWYDRWAERQRDAEGDSAAALAKLEGYAARLALVHHVATHASDGRDAQPIGADAMAAGIALAEWFAGESERIYDLLAETDDEREHRRLVDYIRDRGGTVTPRDLQRANGKRWRTTEDATAALALLAQAGLGAWLPIETAPQGGRPSARFRLSDSPTSDKTPHLREEARENNGEKEVLSVVSDVGSNDARGFVGREVVEI